MRHLTKIFVSAAALLLVGGCGDDTDAPGDASAPASTAPNIIGCNSVRYQGFTYSGIGCAPGIASFDVTTTQNGHTASFHIECRGGCVAAVTAR